MAEAKSFDVNGTEVILKDEYARKEIKKTNENLNNITFVRNLNLIVNLKLYDF